MSKPVVLAFLRNVLRSQNSRFWSIQSNLEQDAQIVDILDFDRCFIWLLSSLWLLSPVILLVNHSHTTLVCSSCQAYATLGSLQELISLSRASFSPIMSLCREVCFLSYWKSLSTCPSPSISSLVVLTDYSIIFLCSPHLCRCLFIY